MKKTQIIYLLDILKRKLKENAKEKEVGSTFLKLKKLMSEEEYRNLLLHYDLDVLAYGNTTKYFYEKIAEIRCFYCESLKKTAK